MSFLAILFSILLIVCSVAVTVVVVLQSDRGSGMSAITGNSGNRGGKGQSAKREMLMKRLTIVFGFVFVVAVVVMNVIELSGFGG